MFGGRIVLHLTLRHWWVQNTEFMTRKITVFLTETKFELGAIQSAKFLTCLFDLEVW